MNIESNLSFPGLLDGLESVFRLFFPTDNPLLAQFWVETRCNLKCGGCQIHEQPHKIYSDINLAEMKAAIIALRKMRVRLLHLTGGETFLNPYLTELVLTARSKDTLYSAIPIVTIVTNGITLIEMSDTERKRVINGLSNSGLTHLSFSVDSLHWSNPQRRKTQLRALIALSQEIAKYHIIPTINWVLCSTDNSDEVLDVAQQVISSGCHFNLLLYSSVGGEFSILNDNLIPTKVQVESIAQKLLTEKKYNYTPPFGTVANMVRELIWMINDYDPQQLWSCKGSNHPVITIKPTGSDISPKYKIGFCQEFSYPKEVNEITGNIYREIRKSSFTSDLIDNCSGCLCSSYIRLDQRIDGSFGFDDFVYHVVVGAYLRSERLGEFIRKLLLHQTIRQIN